MAYGYMVEAARKTVPEKALTTAERCNLGRAKSFARKTLGYRETFKSRGLAIKIAEQLQEGRRGQLEGDTIYLSRSILGNAPQVAATLCHELAHHETGCSDCTHGFEEGLGEIIKRLAAARMQPPRHRTVVKIAQEMAEREE